MAVPQPAHLIRTAVAEVVELCLGATFQHVRCDLAVAHVAPVALKLRWPPRTCWLSQKAGRTSPV